MITNLVLSLDRIEDLPSPGVLYIHLLGRVDTTPLQRWPGRADLAQVTKWERALRRIERCSSTTVVFAEHSCSALALELLPVADYRIATTDFTCQARLSQDAIWPGMSLYRLSRQIGQSLIRQIFLKSVLTAPECLAFGLIEKIIAANDIDRHWLKELVNTAPLNDLAVRRRLMQDSLDLPYEDALGSHLAACQRSLR